MRAIEFIFEAKGDKILRPNQWAKQKPLIIKGLEKDKSQSLKDVDPENEEQLVAVTKNLIQIDPTAQGSYELAIIKWWSNGEFVYDEDKQDIRDMLQKYDILKRKKKLGIHSNIMKYTKDAITNAVTDILIKDRAQQAAIQRELDKKAGIVRTGMDLDRGELIYEKGNFKVYIPHNAEQARNACKMPKNATYGNEVKWSKDFSGTTWCTHQANMFNNYNSQGPMYAIYVNDGEPSNMRAFQLHIPSGQFKKENDTDLEDNDIAFLSTLPGYTEFLNKLIYSEYGKYFEK